MPLQMHNPSLTLWPLTSPVSFSYLHIKQVCKGVGGGNVTYSIIEYCSLNRLQYELPVDTRVYSQVTTYDH